MIRALVPADAERCDAIVESLPDWFGNDQGIAECAAAVRAQPGLVEVVDGEVAGFLTWKQHHPGSAEITWLAVHIAHRGLGSALVSLRQHPRGLPGAGLHRADRARHLGTREPRNAVRAAAVASAPCSRTATTRPASPESA